MPHQREPEGANDTSAERISDILRARSGSMAASPSSARAETGNIQRSFSQPAMNIADLPVETVRQLQQDGILNERRDFTQQVEASVLNQVLSAVERQWPDNPVLSLVNERFRSHGLNINQLAWTPSSGNGIGTLSAYNKIGVQLQFSPALTRHSDGSTSLTATLFLLHDEAGLGGAIADHVKAGGLMVDQMGFRFDLKMRGQQKHFSNFQYVQEVLVRGEMALPYTNLPPPESETTTSATEGNARPPLPGGPIQGTLGSEAGMTVSWNMQDNPGWVQACGIHLAAGLFGSIAGASAALATGDNPFGSASGLATRFGFAEAARLAFSHSQYLVASKWPNKAKAFVALPDRIDFWNNLPTVGVVDCNGSPLNGAAAATWYPRVNFGVGPSYSQPRSAIQNATAENPGRAIIDIWTPRQDAIDEANQAAIQNGDIELGALPARSRDASENPQAPTSLRPVASRRQSAPAAQDIFGASLRLSPAPQARSRSMPDISSQPDRLAQDQQPSTTIETIDETGDGAQITRF